MNFDFSEDQKLLQQVVNKYLEANAPLSVCRGVLESDQFYSQDLWKAAVDLGWVGARIPEEYGGAGFGYMELAVIAEELGRALAPIPFSSSVYLATEAILLAGTEAQKERYLPRLASGEIIGTFAMPEKPGQNCVEQIEIRFEEGCLYGTKSPVPDGKVADFAVVVVRSDNSGKKLSLVIVDLCAEGVEKQPLVSFDPSRPQANLSFDGASAELLGEDGDGVALADRLLNGAAVLVAFEQIGGATRALAMTQDFSLERYVFGRPVASFQAVKHNLADRWSEIELARSCAYYGVWALSSGARELGEGACLARIAASDAFGKMSEEAIQIHGGVGYTWEYDCHLFYRRAQLLQAVLGSTASWKQKLIDRIPAHDTEGQPIDSPSRSTESECDGMDFNDSPEEAAFRAQAQAWLEAHAEKKASNEAVEEPVIDAAAVVAAKVWQKKKADAGWACLHWPKEYGGRGVTPIQDVIWGQEEAKFHTADDVFAIGHGMCGPTIMTCGTPEQKAKWLPRLLSGEDIWCQLFSEPSAGSDLAGLRTSAVREGDEWIINGQKIWTTGAQFCDWGILVTRHDSKVAKHKGLTFFVVDMHSVGIEVRPIIQINGDQDFNEVFFTDVRIPDSNRLGEVGDGWRVAITTLMNERASIASDSRITNWAKDLYTLAQDMEIDGVPALEDRAVREQVASFYVRNKALDLSGSRILSVLSQGNTPGPEASLLKLVWGPLSQEIARYAIELQGISAATMDPEFTSKSGLWQDRYLYIPGYRIAGGADEVMRNIISERVLGLPAEVRMDKGIAFNKIPTGQNSQ